MAQELEDRRYQPRLSWKAKNVTIASITSGVVALPFLLAVAAASWTPATKLMTVGFILAGYMCVAAAIAGTLIYNDAFKPDPPSSSSKSSSYSYNRGY